MAKRIVILGAGTAGIMMANHLRKRMPECLLTIVDRTDRHLYQPGLLFLPFGVYEESQIIRPTKSLLRKGVEFIQAEISKIDGENSLVELQSGKSLAYDVLVVATGCRTAPEETEGMLDSEWYKSVFDFYTLDGARHLRDRLAAWPGGRLVVHVNEMPIKCPVAPLEFCFLADTYFRRKNMREKVTLTYVTPLSGAFTKPEAAKKLNHLLAEKQIELVTDFAAEKLDSKSKKLVCYDGREVPFDLLVTTPTNMGDKVVQRSGMGDDLGFIATHKHTLQSLEFPNVFILGDATNLPTSKAGSVAHFEAETVVDNIERFMKGAPLLEHFDGHANCFIESGNGKALLIDFNYTIDPHEGKFPYRFGPMSLLKESRLNHWGKLAFRHVYFHLLLPARWIPGITRNKTAIPRSTGERT